MSEKPETEYLKGGEEKREATTLSKGTKRCLETEEQQKEKGNAEPESEVDCS